MQRVALVTDSTAGLSSATARELGIRVVPASYAFAEERVLDGAVDWSAVYARMEQTGVAPRTFGSAESAFRTAFEAGLQQAETVFCLVAPFDVNPSFTTACAAMLAIQFDEREARIKVANAGVGSAGLGALLITLAGAANRGASLDALLELVETLEPACDSLFVPADPAWLGRAGRLAMIEDRLGSTEGRFPVIRIGTRLTGVAVEDTHAAAIECLVRTVGARAGGASLNVSVVHAAAPKDAELLAAKICAAHSVERLEIAELTATHGSQLGPGAIGAGACPAVGKD